MHPLSKGTPGRSPVVFAETAAMSSARSVPVSVALSLLLLAVSALLLYADSFRRSRYVTGAGVEYPYWDPPVLSYNEQSLEWVSADCQGAPPENLACALYAKVAAPDRNANEEAVIVRATASDRSRDYCNEFYGPCSPQPANIELDDARRILDYLASAYLEPARENIARGRMSRAHDQIRRIGYLLGRIDLPLGSEGCCTYSQALYIAPAFLANQEPRWRDRTYVAEVLALGQYDPYSAPLEQGEPSPYADVSAYTRAIMATGARCHDRAAAQYLGLATTDGRRAVRELATYMALVSHFRAVLPGEMSCPEQAQPPRLTEEQVAQLKPLVRRTGFLSDIAQMDAALRQAEFLDAD